MVVFRGEGLGGNVARHRSAADGRAAARPGGRTTPASQKTAEVAKRVRRRRPQKILAGQPKANGLTMRGFSAAPAMPTYEEVYGLKAAAIAVYPMYKGLAQLVGMDDRRQGPDAGRRDRRARARRGTTTTSSSSTSSTPTAGRGRQLRREGAR